MARGGRGAFGGKKINSYGVWLCSAPCSSSVSPTSGRWRVRNLDLLALLSFSVSLWYFNHGRIFASVVARLPRARLPARANGLDRRPRPAAAHSRPLWPVWVLAAATVFVARLQGRAERARLERDRRRLRRARSARSGSSNGQSPYGHFPVEGTLKAVRTGRPGGRDPRADPDERSLRVGEPERRHLRARVVHHLPARLRHLRLERASGTTLRRRTSRRSPSTCSASSGSGSSGGASAAAARGTLAFAWAAYPFTQYVSNSNTNDAIMPAFLIWGFWL